MSKRPVKQISAHAVPFVPGCGQLKTTLNSELYSGMKLTATDRGVDVDYKGTSFVIPWGNIIVATYSGPEESVAQVKAA